MPFCLAQSPPWAIWCPQNSPSVPFSAPQQPQCASPCPQDPMTWLFVHANAIHLVFCVLTGIGLPFGAPQSPPYAFWCT